MRKFKIGDTWIHFPFTPYASQEAFMTKMLESLQNGQNALLESPTGTGKTLCLLGTSLAWIDNIRKIEEFESVVFDGESIKPKGDRKHTILFCSRTHSQLMQAISEFHNTGYGHLRAAVLGARRHLCLHPSALSAEGSLDNKCRALRRETKCGEPSPDIEELPRKCTECKKEHQCPYYTNYEEMIKKRKHHPFTHCGALDQKSLKEKCKKYQICPFYTSRLLAKQADIIFLPYSYIFNPHILSAMQINLKDAVLIIDEGHNIERVCEENASFTITSSDFSKCSNEVSKAKEHILDEEFPKDVGIGHLQELEEILNRLYLSLSIIKEGSSFDGQHLLELFCEAGFTKRKDFFMEVIRKLIQFLGEEDFKELKPDGLKKVNDVVKSLFYLEGHSDQQSVLKESFVLYKEAVKPVKPDEKNKIEPKIFFWCFDAGVIMTALQKRGVLSFIITSGTLSPLGPLRKSLAIPFDIELVNSHVIDVSQVLALSISSVPDSEGDSEDCQRTLLSSKFDYREKNGEKYYAALGLLVNEVASAAPKGLLVFFPSSKVKADCLKTWSDVRVTTKENKELSLFDAIQELKPIFEEPKQTFDLNDLQKRFNANIDQDNSNGACMMGVMSGKISEGIDFKDNYGRAVIMIGLPYPPVHDPWVVHKKRAVERKLGEIGQKNWTLSMAIRPVNQAIGRIIRHRGDYGTIILADARYREYCHRSALPGWLQRSLNHVNFENLWSTVHKFFSSIPMEMQRVNIRAAKEQAETCQRHSTILRNEEVPSSDYNHLREMRDLEKDKTKCLLAEYEDLRSQLSTKQRDIQRLQTELSSLNSALQETLVEEDWDSDWNNSGDSDWDVVETGEDK